MASTLREGYLKFLTARMPGTAYNFVFSVTVLEEPSRTLRSACRESKGERPQQSP